MVLAKCGRPTLAQNSVLLVFANVRHRAEHHLEHPAQATSLVFNALRYQKIQPQDTTSGRNFSATSRSRESSLTLRVCGILMNFIDFFKIVFFAPARSAGASYSVPNDQVSVRCTSGKKLPKHQMPVVSASATVPFTIRFFQSIFKVPKKTEESRPRNELPGPKKSRLFSIF